MRLLYSQIAKRDTNARYKSAMESYFYRSCLHFTCSMLRITLVDEYDFNNMILIDPIMSRILCGSFLTISAILLLNMLIALLSDTCSVRISVRDCHLRLNQDV